MKRAVERGREQLGERRRAGEPEEAKGAGRSKKEQKGAEGSRDEQK